MMLFFCFFSLFGVSNAAANLNVEAFQISASLYDYGDPVFSQNLGYHVFENSYGRSIPQFNYTPPDVSFTNVELTLDASTYGRQFDRLSHIYIEDIEIWRPSTAEPRGGDVNWTYTKDVSEYVDLFRSDQTISVRLGNIVNDIYTGKISYNLTINFFSAEDGFGDTTSEINTEQSSLSSNVPSLQSQKFANNIISIGDQNIQSITGNWTETLEALSRNTTSVVLEIFASGNSHEEFWYSNTLDKYSSLQVVTNAGLYGRAPSRIIQVYIDNELAGYAYPFPIIYTGGIAPQLWSPIVGIDAFDVPSYRIDLTPFLPRLWNSSSEITFSIGNGLDNEPVNSDWLFNAHLLTWETQGVIGSGYRKPTNDSHINTSTYGTPPDKSLFEVVRLQSQFHSKATLFFEGGDFDSSSPIDVDWIQSTNYTNYLSLTNKGDLLDVVQQTEGTDSFSHNVNGIQSFNSRFYSYPLMLSTFANDTTSYTLITRALNTSSDNITMVTYENASAVLDIMNGTAYPRTYETEQWLKKRGATFDYGQHARAYRGELLVNETGTASLFPGNLSTNFDPSLEALRVLLNDNHGRIQAMQSQYGHSSTFSMEGGMLLRTM